MSTTTTTLATLIAARAGSVSHGTMLGDHIRDAVVSFLDDLIEDIERLPGADDPSGEIRRVRNRAFNLVVWFERTDPSADTFEEGIYDALYDVDTLILDMSGGAFSFCTHPGDGSDLGVWPVDILD